MTVPPQCALRFVTCEVNGRAAPPDIRQRRDGTHGTARYGMLVIMYIDIDSTTHWMDHCTTHWMGSLSMDGSIQARRLGGFGGFGRTALRLERSGWATSLGGGGRVAVPPVCLGLAMCGHRIIVLNRTKAGNDGRRIASALCCRSSCVHACAY